MRHSRPSVVGGAQRSFGCLWRTGKKNHDFCNKKRDCGEGKKCQFFKEPLCRRKRGDWVCRCSGNACRNYANKECKKKEQKCDEKCNKANDCKDKCDKNSKCKCDKKERRCKNCKTKVEQCKDAKKNKCLNPCEDAKKRKCLKKLHCKKPNCYRKQKCYKGLCVKKPKSKDKSN